MLRRNLIKSISSGAVAALVARREAAAQQTVERAARGMRSPIIKDVSVIATAPAGLRLCVVKITTDQDGLYGYGCATFTQRADLVVPAVEKYLKPFLIGKPADRIDDTWQACYNSSYWRNGPVLNNAISGVDQALWDIKGRQAGLPVYQLLGGKCPRGGGLLFARRRRGNPASDRERAKADGGRVPPRARAGGRPRHGGLWRGTRRHSRDWAARRSGVRAGLLHTPRAQTF